MADFNTLNKLSALNKKQDKDAEKDPIQKMIENNPCGLCKAMKLPICKCRRPGGGSSGGGDSKSGDSPKSYEPEQAKSTATKDKLHLEELIFDEGIEAGLGGSSQTEEEQLLLEQIMQLVVINNYSGKGILTIRAKPGHLAGNEKEVEEFLKAIEAAFEQFKTGLEKQHIPVDNFTCIPGKNELVIRIPVPKYFDAFIQDLIAKKLLPSENTKQNDNIPNAPANPTPFALTPSPSINKKDDLEQNDVEDVKRSSLSPFSTELKPKFTIDS